MEVEEIKVRDRVGMRGLKNRGIIEISEDKTGSFVLVISKGIKKKGPLNLPEAMWRIKCSKDEVLDAVKTFITEKILT